MDDASKELHPGIRETIVPGEFGRETSGATENMFGNQTALQFGALDLEECEPTTRFVPAILFLPPNRQALASGMG